MSSSGGQISIMEALSRIESRTIKERSAGLNDLRHILQHNRDNPELSNFDDKSFHKIFEVLFVVASEERSAYLKSLSSTSKVTKSGAITRFTNCSQTLRLAVERGSRNIRLRTLKALLDHLTETLLDSQGSCCEPIALDYSRCLSAVLAYEPHVEHLKEAQWKKVALFCLDRIAAAVPSDVDEDPQSSSNRLSGRSSRTLVNASHASSTSEHLPKQAIDEFVTSLRHLTSSPVAPVSGKGKAILATMLQYLHVSQSVNQAQVNALSTVNNVLLQIRGERTQVTISVTQSCIQIARILWGSKLAAIKNEVLIMLVLLQPYVRHILQTTDNATFRADLDSMVEILRSEYARRDQKDQLRLDDLRLSHTAESFFEGLKCQIFSLRDGIASSANTSNGEQSWTLLRLLVGFSTFNGQGDMGRENSPEPRPDNARKRVKITHWSDELLRMLYDLHIPTKISSLQLICFAAQSGPIDEHVLERVVERLTALCTDENGLVVSWALLTLASCATQLAATAKKLSRYWTPIWHLAARLINSASTCRASCHLLYVLLLSGLVERSTFLDTCDAMVSSIEINGPSSLSDSVALFLASIIIRLQHENLRSSKGGAEKIVNWLFRTWNPSNFRDRTFATHSSYIEPLDVLNLINACLSRRRTFQTCQTLPVWGPVAQAWISHQESSGLIDYLLLNDSKLPFLSEWPQETTSYSPNTIPSSNSVESLVLSLAAAEVNRAIEQLDHAKDQRGSSLNRDVVRIVSSLAIVAACLGHCHSIQDSRRVTQLRSNTNKLLDTLFQELSSQSCEQPNVDALLDMFAHCMVLSGSHAGPDHAIQHSCISVLAGRVTTLLQIKGGNTQTDVFAPDNGSDDGMDIDANFASQRPQGRNTNESGYPSKLIQSAYHPVTQKMGIAVYAKLMQYVHPIAEGMDVDQSALEHLTYFLVGLSNSELIASRPMVIALFDHVGHFSPEGTGELLNRILDGPFRSYEYERSETTHAFVLELMLREIGTWSDANNSDLYQDGADLYNWLTATALPAGMLSSPVQKKVCTMLLQLLQIDPDYGQKESLPSIRTTLFGMLQKSKLEVGHYLAEHMSSIFSLYTLSKHDEVFDDLNHSLPTDVEWTEGIAIRLLSLAHTASSWPSLLRRCIYGIFETAGQVTSSAAYATYCVAYISQALGLESSQELFKLFAPQLLFTWLDLSRPIENVPYQSFGYADLIELLQQNLEEVYAQLLIRNNSKEIEWLAESLRMTEEKILRSSFSKAVAYAISWDIVFDKERQNTCESRLRDLMKTKNEYHSLVREKFPYIIAQVYTSLDQDDLVEKALEKRPKYKYASDALHEMKSYGSSDRILPSTQQPHFKAKYLPDQMQRAARRAGASSQQEAEPIADDLTASNLTIILRSVLDTMQPALGPLHAGQVVRKLRLLIAFAGDNAVQGYPLELLLRTLRPLAVESHCADDVIGILQYLFHHGMPYLTKNVSTLTSMGLLLLLSMKSFMVSRQDRTTQESQFRVTVSKMHIFHDWLVKYLLGCQDALGGKEDAVRKKIFLTLVQSCRYLSLPASADRGNTASAMLQALMDDEQSRVPILSRLERKKVVALLCHRFESPSLPSQDILGSDSKSTDYARCVLTMTRSLSQADEYEAWAARVLGRAFASSVSPELVRPTGRLLPDFIDFSTEQLYSMRAITAKLESLLLGDNRAAVGVSERVLRSIMARFDDAKRAVDFENLLPPQIVEAMAETYRGDTPNLGRSSFLAKSQKDELVQAAKLDQDKPLGSWVCSLATAICNWVSSDPVVSSLGDLLGVVEDSAQQLFPFLLHLALQAEQEKEQIIRAILTESFTSHFKQVDISVNGKARLMLETVLYLLTQPIPQETTRMDRLQWLGIDYLLAAEAATKCNMPTAALYLIELVTSPTSKQDTGARSRRSSVDPTSIRMPSNELLLDIYKSVDDPDSFYGVEQVPSLQSVMDRVDHERDGLKGIMLHSARMDASLRRTGQAQESDSQGVVKAMGAMNLNNLTHGLLGQSQSKEHDAATTEAMLDSARKLQQWDLAPPQDSSSNTAMLYEVCRSMSAASSLDGFKADLSSAMRSAHRKLQDPQLDTLSIRSTLSALAVLAEVDELTAVRSAADLDTLWGLMQTRQQGWDIGRFDDAQHIISYRETFFGILAQNSYLRESLHVSIKDSRKIEVKAVVKQSEFARKNDLIQQSLVAATYLSELVPVCAESGVKIDAIAKFEAASILWREGEISSSVQMLQELRRRTDLDEQSVEVGTAGILAQLGHEIAFARLEKPEEIITQYLKPAITQLGRIDFGSEAGRVFHEFASFCDQQLQNTGNVEDFQRLERLCQRRQGELQQLKVMIDKTPSSQKDNKKNLKIAEQKAKQWFNLDIQEYRKARDTRDEFVRQSLENYLRALVACDDFDSSVVRFFALWLEHFDSTSANDAVDRALHSVPSWKFVGLTNQMTSRLLKNNTEFQKTLSGLVTRMCLDHPYHTVQNIYAGAMSQVSQSDEPGKLRKEAANGIKDYLRNDRNVGDLATRIWRSCHVYVQLAQAKIGPPPRGQKLLLSSVKIASDTDKAIRIYKVPPATLNVELRPAADYFNIPVVHRFRSEIKIAGGLSAPKILTAQATDGNDYRQLFKGGNDDLRQDAIMEQVFAEVSKMLQNHKATRQRNIRIRTYKVIPLTSNAGIIEFVPNSLPLAEFLNPAHAKYHPTDMKTEHARAKIQEAAKNPGTKEGRYKAYREVTAHYQPVLRHFFFERFEDPNEWFERRLAYTRSTAAISILGYVLGLGDRHTHNILLDEKSGEVIHIDLGVAFEAGRVLPIPEVVPFRMTRDIVDGMGVTKTEGVFRRSCEFTLEALREETDGIMTLLNVLRYDPLYTWTLSPLRAKRIQDAQETEDGLSVPSSKRDDEAGEADRALSVVQKKLSKTLSVAATVNELIQTATDERNLAVLFAGWAAYA